MIIRPALPNDATQMTALLNAIIAKGGTTAHEDLYDAATMLSHYISPPSLISCHVADDDGVIGFQFLAWPAPASGMDEGWAIIASFVADGMGGKGVGKQLFAATCKSAQAVDVKTIDATIRADNIGGLAYYGAMGFADFDRLVGVPLKDGTAVDRVRKRFDF